jgi:hypothetical protein
MRLETVAVIARMASISAGAHAVGIGFVADVVMVGGGVVCFGVEAWRAGKGVLLFWKTATDSDSRLHRSTKDCRSAELEKSRL